LVKTGLTSIPGIPTVLVIVCCPILVALNFITDLSYGASTTTTTIRVLLAIQTSELIARIKQQLSDLRQRESLAQRMNPFRIIIQLINIPFEILIFSAHVVSMGITTDRLGRIPPMFVALGCALPEALQDASFFLAGEHDHDHGGLVMSALIWTKNIVLVASLIPVLSGVWHWLFRKEDPVVTFWQAICNAIKQACDIHEHETSHQTTTAPVLSQAWNKLSRSASTSPEADARPNPPNMNAGMAEDEPACPPDPRSKQKQPLLVHDLTQGTGQDKPFVQQASSNQDTLPPPSVSVLTRYFIHKHRMPSSDEEQSREPRCQFSSAR